MEFQQHFVNVSDLRVGLFVHLDTGWFSHPFPVNSFKLQTSEQIATIRGLGLKKIRYSPDKSDPEEVPQEVSAQPVATAEIDPQEIQKQLRRKQDAALKACDDRFSNATKGYKQIIADLKGEPARSWGQSKALVSGVLEQIQGLEEVSIRLLSEQIGDRASQHSINVLVLSLLLGKSLGLNDDDLLHLGAGALLHDMGKQDLPDRLKWFDEQFTAAETKLHQEHVSRGVILGRSMNLPDRTLLCIAQHHEAASGTGYPMRLKGDQISPLANILALTNRYDMLCNPANPAATSTPHEALSTLFTRFKGAFDSKILNAFVRMMGVYPPGTVVGLSDNRFGMVVSVNASRPLKPSVIVYDPVIPKEDALIVNLEQCPDITISRSIKTFQLPQAVSNYLAPRNRICYFFERGATLGEGAPL